MRPDETVPTEEPRSSEPMSENSSPETRSAAQDEPEGASATTGAAEGENAPEGNDDEDGLEEELEPACRVCGCTESHACEGGCHWVQDPEGGDLCSACLEKLEQTGAPITDEELRRPRPREFRGAVTKNLIADVDDFRREELERESTETLDKWMTAEEEKKASNDTYNAQIKAHRERALKIRSTLKTGKEELPIECVWEYDWLVGRRRLLRTDTYDVVEDKAIDAEELEQWRRRQEPGLFTDEQEAPATNEPREAVASVPFYGAVKCNVCGWITELEVLSPNVPSGMVCASDGCESLSLSVHGEPVLHQGELGLVDPVGPEDPDTPEITDDEIGEISDVEAEQAELEDLESADEEEGANEAFARMGSIADAAHAEDVDA